MSLILKLINNVILSMTPESHTASKKARRKLSNVAKAKALYDGLLPKVVMWLLSSCKGRKGLSLSELLPLISSISSAFSSRGYTGGFAYVKAVRGNFLNFLSGNPKRIPGVKVRASGIPYCFGSLAVRLERGTVPVFGLQLILTVLMASRSLQDDSVKPDTDSITQDCKVLKLPEFVGYTQSFWRHMGYYIKHTRIPRALLWKSFHYTTKSGPNGPALFSWLRDLVSLPAGLREDLGVIGGDVIKERMESLLNWTSYFRIFFPSEKGETRRLSFFADKEGKVRMIGILDYFSQSVLRGLHFYLYKVLKRIPQDYTFDQGRFRETIKDWEIYYSVDLSSATDRFPIKVISQVLKGVLPAQYVEAWERIMVAHEFRLSYSTKGKKPNIDYEVSYAVGNPMGAYSSWASFAVAHHFIMFFLCRKLGKDWYTAKYCILGDDLLIGDKELGEAYLDFVPTRLGVDISESKTHISPHFCEFAKRYFYRGAEISAFPISALTESRKRYYLLVELINRSGERGIPWTLSVPEVVAKFYGIVDSKPKRYVKRMAHLSELFSNISGYIRDLQTGVVTIRNLFTCLGLTPDVYDITEEAAKRLFVSVLFQRFREGFSYHQRRTPPKNSFRLFDLVFALGNTNSESPLSPWPNLAKWKKKKRSQFPYIVPGMIKVFETLPNVALAPASVIGQAPILEVYKVFQDKEEELWTRVGETPEDWSEILDLSCSPLDLAIYTDREKTRITHSTGKLVPMFSKALLDANKLREYFQPLSPQPAP